MMLLSLKMNSYEEYFDVLLLEKKESEWDTYLKHIKENKELENSLKKRMKEEDDFENIIYVLTQLWDSFKKTKMTNNDKSNLNNNNNQNNTLSNNIFGMKLLSEILEILYKENKYFRNKMEKSKNLLNFNIMIQIKCMKIFSNQKENYFSKFQNIIESNLSRINFTLAIELLRNDGFYMEALKISKEYNQNNYIKSIMSNELNQNPSNSEFLISYDDSQNILSDMIEIYLEKIKIPTHWKTSEFFKCISFKENGTMAVYNGDDQIFYTLKSNWGISSSLGIYYFEVEILNIGNDM